MRLFWEVDLAGGVVSDWLFLRRGVGVVDACDMLTRLPGAAKGEMNEMPEEEW